jgi:hypothetical protein
VKLKSSRAQWQSCQAMARPFVPRSERKSGVTGGDTEYFPITGITRNVTQIGENKRACGLVEEGLGSMPKLLWSVDRIGITDLGWPDLRAREPRFLNLGP